MSSLAVALKTEIVRLARKEARSITKSLSKASTQHRKDIAKLKRQNASALAEIGRLLRQASKGGAAPVAEAPAEKIRYSAASVRAQRKRLGLSAVDFAALLGVAAATVLKWERGTSRPRTAQVKSFAAVRGLGKTEANACLLELRAKAPKGRKKSK
jgi:DNA-binding transcriptional regulator YiaG